MKKHFFSKFEISELEALEIRGGADSVNGSQTGCSNYVAYCGWDVTQNGCSNHASACGMKPISQGCTTNQSCTIKPGL
jgi:hypothetical protein